MRLTVHEKDYIIKLVEERIEALLRRDREGHRLDYQDAHEIMYLTRELKEFKKDN